MKRIALVLGSLLIAATASAKEVVAAPVVVAEPVVEAVAPVVETPEAKKWVFKTGVNHTERQQGRMNSNGYNWGIPDDLGEDGDVSEFFTTLGYKINDKWAVDYKFAYAYITDIESFNSKDKKVNDDKANTQMHTVRLIRTFEPFDFLGTTWNSNAWVGVRKYRESSLTSGNDDVYGGFNSERLLASANMRTALTEKTTLDLNYLYNYRKYEYLDESKRDTYQHRHWITTTVDHDFTDSIYMSLQNILYLRQHVTEQRNYGEWDYNYTLGHKYPLGNGYSINTEATAWGEVPLWEKGNRPLSNDHNQAELVLMPKLKKKYKVSDDVSIDAFIGAGYVYGYDVHTNKKMYAGFEGRVGTTFDYKF
ncbi:MAG: hypothetical protein ACRC7W_02775 [Fusobacteriaceae bacterium]